MKAGAAVERSLNPLMTAPAKLLGAGAVVFNDMTRI